MLRLLLMVCVLWCGMHIAEPVQAHGEALHHLNGADSSHPDTSDESNHNDKHAMQHHCPVATDHAASGATGAMPDCSAPVFAATAAALPSHSQAPPLEPPAAA